MIVGRAYCVAATSEAGAPSAVKKSPTKHAKGVKKGSGSPSPTQVVLTSTCTTFHVVKGGESCYGIVQKYGTFTLADFNEWNPEVGSSCRHLHLYAGSLVCVGAPGPKPPCSVQAPSPVQDGVIETCGKYHKAEPGEGCWHIAERHGIELDDL